MPDIENKKLYRYDDIVFYEGDIRVLLSEYNITKRTDCGVWISQFGSKPQFVLLQWSNGCKPKKCFAYPTKELARESFIARKERQIQILKCQLYRAQKSLEIIKEKKDA